MIKKISGLLAILIVLTSCTVQPKTHEMLDVLNKNIETLKTDVEAMKAEIIDLKTENEKLNKQTALTYHSFSKDYVYYSEYVPNEMGPGTIIKFISDNEFVIEDGYAVVGYEIDVFEGYPNTHGRYPDPVKGMTVTYASDGFILRIYEP